MKCHLSLGLKRSYCHLAKSATLRDFWPADGGIISGNSRGGKDQIIILVAEGLFQWRYVLFLDEPLDPPSPLCWDSHLLRAPCSSASCLQMFALSHQKKETNPKWNTGNEDRTLERAQEISPRTFLSARIRAAERSCHFCRGPSRSLFLGWDQAAVIRCVTRADSLIDHAMIQQRHAPGRHKHTHTHNGIICN